MQNNFSRKSKTVAAIQLTQENLPKVREFSRGQFTAMILTGATGTIIEVRSVVTGRVERFANLDWWLLITIPDGKCEVMADEVFKEEYEPTPVLYIFCWGDEQRRVGFTRMSDGKWLPMFSRMKSRICAYESDAISAAEKEGAVLVYTEQQEGLKTVAKLVWTCGRYTDKDKERMEADLTYIINER